jgi:RHS repeat-associated protein
MPAGAALTCSSTWSGKRPHWHIEAHVTVTSGTNTVTLVAADNSSNTTTKNYSVSVSGTGATYTYDLNGNLASKTEGATTWTYEWTAENQLKRVLIDGVAVVQYAYDPWGRRVESVAGSAVTAWTYDRSQIVRRTGGAAAEYIYGRAIDEILATNSSAGLGYLHPDALGSVVVATDSAGAVSAARRYDAWGVIEAGAAGEALGFAGREWDSDSELYYSRNRYLNAELGRFVSADPLGYIDGPNLYAYVRGNPARFTDPYGLDSYMCRSGIDSMPFLPVDTHRALCIVDPVTGSRQCRGLVPRDWWNVVHGPGRWDDFDPGKDRCEALKMPSGLQSCVDRCLRQTYFKSPPPNYSVLPVMAENCQSAAQAGAEECIIQCEDTMRWHE